MLKNLFIKSLILCFILINNRVAAQTTQASISGVISDNKRQLLPGASVKVRNESTGFTTGTLTNAVGE